MTLIDDEMEEEFTPTPIAFYSVAIYFVNRAYGGPDEGGWWYDCGNLIQSVPEGVDPQNLIKTFAPNQNEATQTWRDILQQILDDGINKGRRPISSVISTGRYIAMIHEGNPPSHFPQERPHYE